VYRKQFMYQPLPGSRELLVFEGLDTYAEIYINGHPALSANNMFRIWTVDLSAWAGPGLNEIRIIFRSVLAKEKALAAVLPYQLPGGSGVFTRKAAYQYGWDFAPRLITCGIWKNCRLEYRTTDALSGLLMHTQAVSEKGASMVLQVEGNNPESLLHLFCTFSFKQDNSWVDCTPDFQFNGQQTSFNNPDAIFLDFTCPHPKIWNPNGAGAQPLYRVQVWRQGASPAAGYEAGEPLQSCTFGIRTLRLEKEPDTISETFFFNVNNQALYCKGANFVPPDMFLPRVSRETYRHLLFSAARAHFNMLRVWGGGTYADDYFYDLCDSLGILVWQDFMFAGAMYPGDTAFVNNVQQEATDQICRLRNHPCMALWCGNNECKEGWFNWDWQQQYHYRPSDSSKIWEDYAHLFEEVIPKTLYRYTIEGDYIPSSPAVGWGHPESLLGGDSHYWGVWWGLEPFDSYKKHIGRFASEFGFESLPSYSSVEQFTAPADRDTASSVFQAHQLCNGGMDKWRFYLSYYKMHPKNLQEYIQATQQLQAEAMQVALQAQMASRPRCMGSLVWQLNDCWPGASWSLMDYYGNWKPALFTVEEEFK